MRQVTNTKSLLMNSWGQLSRHNKSKRIRPATANRTLRNNKRIESIAASSSTNIQDEKTARLKLKNNEHENNTITSECSESSMSIRKSLIFRANQTQYSNLYNSKEFFKKNPLIGIKSQCRQRKVRNSDFMNTPQVKNKRRNDMFRMTQSRLNNSRSKSKKGGMHIASTIRPKFGSLRCWIKSKF